jgi:hypothetical protein
LVGGALIDGLRIATVIGGVGSAVVWNAHFDVVGTSFFKRRKW